MMAQISNEYGTALFMLAKESGRENEYAKVLDVILSVFSDNPEYTDLLSSSSIPKSERILAIEEAFGNSIPEHIMSFMQLLCERGRISDINSCVIEYKKLLDFSNNTSVAKVISSIELTGEEKEKIKEKLEKMSTHKVFLECSLDESLIGGVIIEIDGKVIDGSLKKRLHDVKDVISR